MDVNWLSKPMLRIASHDLKLGNQSLSCLTPPSKQTEVRTPILAKHGFTNQCTYLQRRFTSQYLQSTYTLIYPLSEHSCHRMPYAVTYHFNTNIGATHASDMEGEIGKGKMERKRNKMGTCRAPVHLALAQSSPLDLAQMLCWPGHTECSYTM